MLVTILCSFGLLLAFQSCFQHVFAHPPINERHDKQPNIIFIITDDQDLHMNSIEYMPNVQKHIRDQGTTYTRHFCTVALCCPSRVSLLTGKAAHNTNVTDVSPPYGGYPKFVTQGLNDAYLPVWLQDAGYNTYYTGKIFNSYTVSNWNKPYLKGWNSSDILLDPNTYRYWNATFGRNQDEPVNYEGQYNTDLVASKALGLLAEAANASNGKPFFLGIAPIAPHTDTTISPDGIFFAPPEPAPKYKDYFRDVRIPRTPNFNPEKVSGASYIRHLTRINSTVIDYYDEFYRLRLRALQSVDEMVGTLFSQLAEFDLLDNTYVVYTADNGYHIGQHRLPAGKSCGYEEDIGVPFALRGPGVPHNFTADLVTTHTDIAATFLSIAGASDLSPYSFDGLPIPLTAAEIEEAKRTRAEHVNVEYWGAHFGEGHYAGPSHHNNTYKAVRVLGPEYNLYYAVWCTNEHELYDLSVDPGQLRNLYHDANATLAILDGTHSLSGLEARLDALLLVLKSCKGKQCTEPWRQLHPRGNVNSLRDAMKPRYDALYTAFPRVEFDRCELGYLVAAEGPQWGNAADARLRVQGGVFDDTPF